MQMKEIIEPIRLPRKFKKKVIERYSRSGYKLIMSGEYVIKYCSVRVLFNNEWIDVVNYHMIKK